MPHEILTSMRALREDMRRRLLQVPEYRALMALDRSIEEICDILCDTLDPTAPLAVIARDSQAAAAPRAAPAAEQIAPVAPPPAPVRQSALAMAFAESLAAKLDQRAGARSGSTLG